MPAGTLGISRVFPAEVLLQFSTPTDNGDKRYDGTFSNLDNLVVPGFFEQRPRRYSAFNGQQCSRSGAANVLVGILQFQSSNGGNRRSGVSSALPNAASKKFVSAATGFTAFTRMSGASSTASDRVSVSTAPFEAL